MSGGRAARGIAHTTTHACYLHGEVPRDAVVAAEMHDACAAGAGGPVVLVDHGTHPVRLAGDVAVVGAVAGAELHEERAVDGERSGGGEDHLKAARAGVSSQGGRKVR